MKSVVKNQAFKKINSTWSSCAESQSVACVVTFVTVTDWRSEE